MTDLEKKIAMSLSQVTFLPGTFDKRFYKQLHKWTDRDMTEKGREFMIKIFHKYRRQIDNYETLKSELENQKSI